MTYCRGRKLAFVITISLALISGIVIVTITASTEYISINDVALPGVLVEETVFSTVIDYTQDSAVFAGTWTEVPSDSYRVNLSLPPRSLTSEETQDIARSFISRQDLAYLNYSGMTDPQAISIPSFLDDVIDCHLFLNETENKILFSVEICVNSVSGKVIAYSERWTDNEAYNNAISIMRKPFMTGINQSLAERIASQFLQSRNYTIQPSTRLVRSRLGCDFDNIGKTKESAFEIVLRRPFGKVFPEQKNDGIRVLVSEEDGRIVHFSYFLLNLPDTNENHVINPIVALRQAEASVPFRDWNRSAVFEQEYLRLVRCFEPDGTFALSWRFEYSIEEGNCTRFTEIGWGDALNGRYLYPGLYFGISGTTNPDIAAPVLILGASSVFGIVAKVVFLRTKRDWRQ